MKITLEFEDEDNRVDRILNIHKLEWLLQDLYNFRRDIVKGYVPENNKVVIVDNEVVTDEMYNQHIKDFNDGKVNTPYIKNSKSFISTEYLLDKLDELMTSDIVEIFLNY